MSDSNTSSEIDVDPTESVAQDDADELSEQLGIDIQLIDEGFEHENDAEAIRTLRDELDPEDPPESVHMTAMGDEGFSNYYLAGDELDVDVTTDVMGHLATHLQEVGQYLGYSPAATAYLAATVADRWNRMDEMDVGEE